MGYFNYHGFFTRERIRSFLSGLFFLGVAVAFQYYASAYANRVPGTSVPDLFLSLLPIVNVNFIIVEGALVAIALSLVLILAKPNYLLFSLKAAAIFIATRAVFISVTHVGIYPGQIGPDPTGIFDRLYLDLGLEAGFFFSGHTGLTFLMGLVFWNDKLWRYIYLILSAAFGVAVLLAHVHYSIDVLAAPYMAYGIYKMTAYFFPEDYKLTQ